MNNLNENKIKTNGIIEFFATEEGIKYIIVDEQESKNIIEKAFKATGIDEPESFKKYILDILLSYNVKGYFVNGKDFVERILSGEYTKVNGKVNGILVDRYISNLGIFYRSKDGKFANFGDFEVTPDVFEKFCNEHEVMVDWSEGNGDLSSLLDFK